MKKGKKEIKDPVTSFKDTMSAVAVSLSLSQSYITKMKEKADGLKNIEDRNPTAYVLGFLASNKGTSKILDKETVLNVFKQYLPQVEDKSIKEADVVRYGRLWLNL